MSAVQYANTPSAMSSSSPLVGGTSAGGSSSVDDASAVRRREGKVFVGGLPWNTGEDVLRQYFSDFGAVKHINLITDQATGRSRGYGFVIFENEKSLKKVFEQKEHRISGKRVDVKSAFRRNAEPPVTKLFVGGVDLQSLSENDLREYFGRFGEIDQIDIPFDREKNQPRNFCFITFLSAESVEEAVQLGAKHRLGGRMVDVKKATPRPENGRGGLKDFSSSPAGGPMGGYGSIRGGIRPRGRGRGRPYARSDEYYGGGGDYYPPAPRMPPFPSQLMGSYGHPPAELQPYPSMPSYKEMDWSAPSFDPRTPNPQPPQNNNNQTTTPKSSYPYPPPPGQYNPTDPQQTNQQQQPNQPQQQTQSQQSSEHSGNMMPMNPTTFYQQMYHMQAAALTLPQQQQQAASIGKYPSSVVDYKRGRPPPQNSSRGGSSSRRQTYNPYGR